MPLRNRRKSLERLERPAPGSYAGRKMLPALKTLTLVLLVAGCLAAGAARAVRTAPASPISGGFPRELVDWVPYEGNPLFAGTGQDTWDREIRERGFILREGDAWRLWYTGYDSTARARRSRSATPPRRDGLRWTRHPRNPVFDGVWTEDVFVVSHAGRLPHVRGGDGRRRAPAHVGGRRRWEEQGRLDIRTRSGEPLSAGAYGTPSGLGRGRDLLPLLRARRQGHLARHLERTCGCGRTSRTSP